MNFETKDYPLKSKGFITSIQIWDIEEFVMNWMDIKEFMNDKRVLRICRKYDIKSNIKWKPKSCTRGDRNPDHIAKNYLHREFHAEKPNEKWLTDVSEFKYYNGIEVHKVYLSAILDLYDRRIVSFKISDHNDNPLVMDTFDEAVRQSRMHTH